MTDINSRDVFRRPSRDVRHTGVRLTYLVLGAILGGLGLWGGDEPAWEHILRTGLFVVVVLPASYYGAQRLRAHRGKSPLPEIHLLRIIAVKLSLLVIALVVTYLIDGVTTHADQILAAGLFVVIAIGGPRCHRFFVPSSSTPLAAGTRK